MSTPSLKAVLLSLPQPLYVFGGLFLFAYAVAHEWVDDPWLLAMPLMLAPVVILSVVERFAARRQDWLITGREALVDASWTVGWYFVWGPIVSSTYDTPISLFFYAARDFFDFSFELNPSTPLGILAAAVFAALLIDLIIYWIHVAQHRSALLWRTHATHHHIPKFSVAKSDRNHPIESLAFDIGPLIVLALLNASNVVIGAYYVLQSTSTYFAHANLPLVSGIYGWVFATPTIHQVHHSLNPEDSNRNFGCVFSIWDRIFGTFSDKQAIERAGNGTGEELSLLSQWTLPFRSNAVLRSL